MASIRTPTHESKNELLLNGAQAGYPGYAFLKKSNHFHHYEKIKLMDDFTYHAASRCYKKPKHQKTNLKRDKKIWIVIQNNLTISACQLRQNLLIILLGEIYRFEIGSTQPKYRAIYHGNGTTQTISEYVPGYQEFYEYFTINLEFEGKMRITFDPKTDYFEGMGRVTFNKWLYLENDYKFGNMCLNTDNYFIGIDHDQGLWPLSEGFKPHLFYGHPKIINRTYSTDCRHSLIKIQDKQDRWMVKGVKRTYMGEASQDDFNNLPFIHDYLAFNWTFEGTKDYALFLAKNPGFLNEKYFSALKSVVTLFVKQALILFHVNHAPDQKYAHQLITNRVEELRNLLILNENFKKYFMSHGIDAIVVIFYEIQKFLEENEHYLYTEPAQKKSQWNAFVTGVISEFEVLHQLISHHDLSLEQKQNLLCFADNIAKNDKDTLIFIKTFYECQGESYHAKKIQDNLPVPQATTQYSGLFFRDAFRNGFSIETDYQPNQEPLKSRDRFLSR